MYKNKRPLKNCFSTAPFILYPISPTYQETYSTHLYFITCMSSIISSISFQTFLGDDLFLSSPNRPTKQTLIENKYISSYFMILSCVWHRSFIFCIIIQLKSRPQPKRQTSQYSSRTNSIHLFEDIDCFFSTVYAKKKIIYKKW